MTTAQTLRRRREAKAAVEALGDPRKTESLHVVDRQGARRPRVRVSSAFDSLLTERQRKVLNGRVRMNKTWGRVLQMIEDSGITMEEFVEGLSNEEIVRGQIKDGKGGFRGAPPKWVPRAFHRACVHELMRRGKKMWQENYLGAIDVMVAIMQNEKVPAKERLRAAQYVVERIEGKIPDVVKIESDQPWQIVIDDIVAEVDPSMVERGQRALASAHAVRQEIHDPRDPIIDAEIVDDTPPPKPVRSRRAPRKKATT